VVSSSDTRNQWMRARVWAS